MWHVGWGLLILVTTIFDLSPYHLIDLLHVFVVGVPSPEVTTLLSLGSIGLEKVEI